ncbi:hypothetical protein SDJN02_13763, partial [Cucurbita argyrosperma subsp. argyrosperma]
MIDDPLAESSQMTNRGFDLLIARSRSNGINNGILGDVPDFRRDWSHRVFLLLNLL